MQTSFAVEPEVPLAFGPAKIAQDKNAAWILYAEDNDDVREIVAVSLRRAGHNVVTVPDGRKAWEQLRRNAFDLLITDNEMPFLTGLELIAKAQREDMSLDVILASGALGQLRGPALATVHIKARLQKPFTRGELLDAVEQALNARRKRTGPFTSARQGFIAPENSNL